MTCRYISCEMYLHVFSCRKDMGDGILLSIRQKKVHRGKTWSFLNFIIK